jgi:cyclic pyranopterin monophosphate synthase
MASKEFTHVDKKGRVKMVDVGEKDISLRTASAKSYITLSQDLLSQLSDKELYTRKGPVFQTAVLAGIMAAKNTSQLIPLCHPLPLNSCSVDIVADDNGLEIICRVSCSGKTGVEMEALVGASIAALTVYDMCKSFGHAMIISETKLITKTGGKSDYHAQ